jgi:hypothetical protein
VGKTETTAPTEFGSYVGRAGVSTFDARTRLRLVLGIFGLLTVLGTVGFAIDAWLTGTLREAVGRELLAAHGGQVEALRLWAEDRQRMAMAAADSRRVKKAAARILEGASEDESLQIAAEEASTITEVAQNFGFSGWAIVRADGTGYGFTDRPVVSDLELSQIDAIQAALSGQPAMSEPMLVKPRNGVQAAFADGQAAMFATAPLHTAEAAPAFALVFRIDPEQQFARILGSSRAGRSEETYAIDRSGVMVSPSRFEAEFRRAGLPNVDRTPLSVVVSDPGVDLTRGKRTSLPRDQWPLTRAASAATRGSPGNSLVPYRDYRGVPVVGMWTWLEPLHVGVITEIAASDAFTLQKAVRVCFWVVGGLLIGVAVLLFWMAIRASRLAKKAGAAEHLGQYRLVRKIGEGGMGAVYLAEHALIRRPTALKVFTPERSAPEQLRRFEREVQITAQLTHPNTVAVYDYGRAEYGVFYYVMEMIDGIDLDELVLLNGPMPVARAIHVARQLAGSLAEAHGCGIVHRDVKPANIMLTRRGGIPDFVKVLDFGLARGHDVTTHLTQAGVLLGTPLYMAPELLNGGETATPRSDVYAAGCVMFFLLTGKDAFSGTTIPAIIARHALGNPYRLEKEFVGSCPSEIVELVHRCIAMEPEKRFQNGAELSTALEALAVHHPWSMEQAKAAWEHQRAKSEQPPPDPKATTLKAWVRESS